MTTTLKPSNPQSYPLSVGHRFVETPFSLLSDCRTAGTEFAKTTVSKLVQPFINGLKRRINQRGLRFQAPYYWREGDDTPFCQPCLEGKDGLRVHLTPATPSRGGIMRFCRVCKQQFWETPPQSPLQRPRLMRWEL